MSPLIRLTPPLLASRRIAGLVMPCILKISKMFTDETLYLDVIPQHLAMSLGTSLAQAFATFASSSHDQYQFSVTGYDYIFVAVILLIFYQLSYLFVLKVHHKML